MGLGGMKVYWRLINGSFKERGFGDSPTPIFERSPIILRGWSYFYICRQIRENIKIKVKCSICIKISPSFVNPRINTAYLENKCQGNCLLYFLGVFCIICLFIFITAYGNQIIIHIGGEYICRINLS